MPDVAKQAAYTQAHLTQMGVKIFDSNGKMRSMIDILRDMNVALKDASDEEKLSAVKAIFGDRAAPGALNIFKSIQTMRLDEVLDKINHSQGAAQEMADRMKATTYGAFLELKSALESISISFGSVLLPTLAKTMRTFAGWANSVSKWAEEHPNVSKVIGYTVIGLISLKVAAIAVGYRFCLKNASYQALKRQNEYKWAELERINTNPSLQFTGFGSETISLDGIIYPQLFGGLRQLNLMRTSAMQGKPLMLISGYGFAFGQWCITSVQENQTIFFKDGTPRRIDFTINLKKYGDDKKRGIMGIVQKVGKYL